jgi:hypothetical protein
MQRHMPAIAERFDRKLERVMSEHEKITQLVKPLSDHQVFIEPLTEWVAMKFISFCLINHQLFREMIQRAHPDFFVPLYNTLRLHIKGLVDVHRQLPAHSEKRCCFLMVDGAKQFGR